MRNQLLLTAMLLGAQSIVKQDVPLFGQITGTVVDERGAPVNGAHGCARPLDAAMVGATPCGWTDSEGRFKIGHLEWGRYRLFGKKEEDGYPSRSGNFYGDDRRQTITLSAEIPQVEVRLVLGPKAGIVIGNVTNAETGDKVFDFTLKLAWVSDPDRWLTEATLPEFRLLVPSNVDLVFRCEMPGSVYGPWDYKTWNPAGTYLRLKPGEELKIDIRLQPKKSVPGNNVKLPKPKTGNN